MVSTSNCIREMKDSYQDQMAVYRDISLTDENGKEIGVSVQG